MLLNKSFMAFVNKSPISVLNRGVLERLFASEPLQQLFDDNALSQYTRKITFFQCIQVMSDVVFRTVPSVCAWYQQFGEDLNFSKQCLFEKLAHVEPNVSAALVAHIGGEVMLHMDQIKATESPLLPGYRVRILDGNHFPGTDHRLKVLHPYNAAALPGQALALYDPRYDVIDHIIPCEDAYTQERSLLDPVVELLEKKDCIVADRNFCTGKFLCQIHRKDAFFVIRHHSVMKYQLVSQARKVGKDEDGRVLMEQSMEVVDPATEKIVRFRRITLPLKQPDAKGNKVLHIITNLPKKVSARKVARLYAKRWTIESAFQQLQAHLNSEINTLAYPKAALFGFSVGCAAYNAVSLIKGALRVAHGEKFVEEELSMYYMTLEIAQVTQGMEIAIPEKVWGIFSQMSAEEFAAILLELAGKIDKKKYTKHKRGPKKPPIKKISGKRHRHKSTARLLAERT